MLTLAVFTVLDWSVLGGYFLLLAGTGVWFARRDQQGTDDYFLGGRSMPAWAVAVSVLATSLSAATFIGGPQQAYAGDLTYLSTNIGMILAAIVIAVWFIPAFYRARVSTVYELLESRCGPGAKQAASAMFMIGRVFASGARLFIVGLPAAMILFGETPPGQDAQVWHLVAAISVVTIVGIVYTLVGGISSVIWSDVIQTGVFLAAVGGTILLLLHKIPVGTGEIAELLAAAPAGEADPGGVDPGGAGKLTLFRTSWSFTEPYTIWAVVVGFTLLGIASYGTDQDLVQRMLTCRSAKASAWSMVSSQLIAIPVVLLFLVAGLLLYVYYKRADAIGLDPAPVGPSSSARVFLHFILREMPAGMSGLMMAGLFAAGLSSLNSAINAMSSTFVSDFYKPMRGGKDERHYVTVGRLAVVGWGLALGAFAILCVFWQRGSGQTLIDFALSVMTFAYAGLLGVFFTVLFTRRGNTASVIAALLVGFVAVLVQQNMFWKILYSDFETAPAWVQATTALAFPWKLTIAAAVAFATCQLGPASRPTRAKSAAPSAAR